MLFVSVCRVDGLSSLSVTRLMHRADRSPCLRMIDLAVSQSEIAALTLRIRSSVSSSWPFCSFRYPTCFCSSAKFFTFCARLGASATAHCADAGIAATSTNNDKNSFLIRFEF